NRPQSDGAWDVAVPLLSAPFLLGTTIEGVRRQSPYIRSAELPSRLVPVLRRRTGHLMVGVSWRSRSPYRSAPLTAFEPLAKLPRVTLVALGGPLDAPPPFPLVDLGRTSIDEEAAVVSALDLIVSVDTMSAHLAGSLGRCGFVLP